jgi:50S ribosomal subunit-associated GTPase HflX
VLNKVDLFDGELVEKVLEQMAQKGIGALPVSAGSLTGIEELKKQINAQVKKG